MIISVNSTAIVIDDDIDTREVFSEFLQLKDVNVLAVGGNGKDAVNLYAKLKPDVIFLDVMMPEYDGFYGLENIRKFDPNANVVMVTADLTHETSKRLEELNASSIIYKPCDMNNAVKIMEQIKKTANIVTVSN